MEELNLQLLGTSTYISGAARAYHRSQGKNNCIGTF